MLACLQGNFVQFGFHGELVEDDFGIGKGRAHRSEVTPLCGVGAFQEDVLIRHFVGVPAAFARRPVYNQEEGCILPPIPDRGGAVGGGGFLNLYPCSGLERVEEIAAG